LEIVGHNCKKSVEIGFAIYDKKSNRLCGINSADLNNFIFDIDKNEVKKVVCSIPDQNLAPGMYHLDIMLRAKGKEVLDYVEHVCSFEILPQDYFGTGKLPKGENIILLKAKWKIK